MWFHKKRKRPDRPVIFVCSPYRGDTEANTQNARRYCRLVMEQGGIPFAPHLLFTQFLEEGKAEERRQALEEYRANWEENTPYIHDHTAAFDFVREDTPEVPGLDEAVRFTFQFSDEDSPRTFYAGRLGNQVVTLYCSGAVDPEGALALMTQRLAEAQ